jgi:hypothetical protein
MSIETSEPLLIELPPGASVADNIAEAREFLSTHTPSDALEWFYQHVRNKGPWDYKQQGSQYEGFGNWHYGAIGTALGIPEQVLKRLAGYAQVDAGTSTGNWWAPIWTAPYGDDPRDQEAIEAGIEWARVNGHQGPSIFLNGPIRIPASFSDDGWGLIHPQGINPTVHEAFMQARAVIPVRDPLAIDLDSDGIETIGITTTPVFFDHDGDGTPSPTGWLHGDDAWLVLDRNGNGAIDAGAELFGTDTLKSNGQFALSGFDALRDLDSDGNGLLNASDTAFAQLQLWQDLNQDGLSQAFELRPLADHGITAIDGFGLPADIDLGNGNRIAATALVMRRDGTTMQAVDLILANEPPLPTLDILEPLVVQASEMEAPIDPPPPDNGYAADWSSPLTPYEVNYAMNELWQMAFNAGRNEPPVPAMNETDAYFANQLDSLINAMAAFAPPPSAQTTLRTDEHSTTLTTTITTSLC